MIRLFQQGSEPFPTIFETPCRVDILHSILLHRIVFAPLPQYIQQMMIIRVTVDTVDDQEGKFALRQILTESLVLRV